MWLTNRADVFSTLASDWSLCEQYLFGSDRETKNFLTGHLACG
ncbi:hypothetical protein RESH_00733 [Rhodopirellula europaea SH398]|uniref:Uncharacterized protein n=1 Tax=Rhodopirellula europaea SH398 TaxID=1263868 RepID=M5SAL5_9BACT|nr:hypothetical protein RESH_00733 [Rhodopirellula europaea SH398]